MASIFFAIGCGCAVIGCLTAFWLGREHAYSDTKAIYKRALLLDEQERASAVGRVLDGYTKRA